MRVGSCFTGIGGFDLGLERAGHEIVWQVEIDPYRRRVLARHWPGVPCFKDIANIGAGDNGRPRTNASKSAERGSGRNDWPNRVDLLCGGFPCQDLSVAGRRAGLDGSRSGLFFEFARVADAVLPDGGWLLIENVPGLLSSNGGRDFAVLLATLAELGFHDLAWRVLDSRYLGVPQRRRRVFILARRSRGRSASEVLLEPESGGGDFEAGREKRTGLAGSVTDGAQSARTLAGNERYDHETEDFVAATLQSGRKHGGRSDDLDDPPLIAHTLTAPDPNAEPRDGKRQDGSRTDRIPLVLPDRRESRAPRLDGRIPTGEGGERSGSASGTSDSESVDGAPAHPDRVREAPGLPGRLDDPVAFRTSSLDSPRDDGLAPPLGCKVNSDGYGGADVHVAGGGGSQDAALGNPKPDGPRYAACGDAVTVNVSYWIGCRLRDFT